MAVSPPFNIAETSPAASDLVSAYPTNEQSNRDIIESWLTFLSDPTTGLLKPTAFPTPLVITSAATGAVLTLTSTDAGAVAGPGLFLKRDSASPADADILGYIGFYGENSISTEIPYGFIIARADDVTSATEDGSILIQPRVNGVNVNRIIADAAGVTISGVLSGDGSGLTNIDPFPSGTRMFFQQTAAPTGWTKEVGATYNDAALRVVTGAASTGGTVAFVTAFASKSVTGTIGGTAITTANLPAHTHTFSDTVTSGSNSVGHTHSFSDTATTGTQSANHTHSFSDTSSADGIHSHSVLADYSGLGTTTVVPNSEGTGLVTPVYASVNSEGDLYIANSASHTHSVSGTTGSNSASHTHSVTVSGTTGSNSVSHTHSVTVSGSTSSIGSGTTHTHTFTGTAINLDVKHVDTIVATKD